MATGRAIAEGHPAWMTSHERDGSGWWRRARVLDREPLMNNHNVVLTVASYASDRAARRDFDAVVRATESGTCRQVALAILNKGPDGALSIDRRDGIDSDGALRGALLGAALTVLAAPAGIVSLPPVVTAPAGWALVTALVTHYWQNVPQDTLRLMSDMLESGPVGVVIVAVDRSGDEITTLLSEASATIINDSTNAGLDVDLDHAIDEATDW
jgi:hypothetical protein